MPNAPEGGVPLSVAINALRTEILRAYWDARNHPVRFTPTPIELTLEAAVTWTGEAGGGVNWWLINLDARASRESAVTQTITMTLEPHLFDTEGREIEEWLIDAADQPNAARTGAENEVPLDAPG
jgi:hypothetical protein